MVVRWNRAIMPSTGLTR
uniref:Uncharacterized protein n=1 Tax=Arundo donax TaxID=35708 RepID=A0A0A9A8Z5_ARUDO